MVRAQLASAHGLPAEAFDLKIIRTSGDVVQDRPLSEVGGKGLFTKEIEEALIAGEIDLAVHSAKDLPTLLPGGLAIVAALPREDPPGQARRGRGRCDAARARGAAAARADGGRHRDP